MGECLAERACTPVPVCTPELSAYETQIGSEHSRDLISGKLETVSVPRIDVAHGRMNVS